MPMNQLSLANIPTLNKVPAACGAVVPTMQVGGRTVFDFVVAVVVVRG
jgi:hypothetical protein